MRKYPISFILICLLSLQTSIGYALEWQKLHEKADRETLRDALTSVVKDPHSLQDLYTLGIVYLNEYKIDDAEQVFRDMLRLDPGSIEAKWGLADVLRRRHKLDQGQAILEEVIRLNPEFSPAYISLGYMLFDKKDYERSIRLALKVIRQGRDNVDLTDYTRAYLIIGGAKGMLADTGGPLSKLVNGTQILPMFRKAEALQPKSAGVLFALGSFYLSAPGFIGGDKNKAFVYLEKAITVDPQFVDAYARLAKAWFDRGDQDKYRMYLRKALQMDPQNELALTVEKMTQTVSLRK